MRSVVVAVALLISSCHSTFVTASRSHDSGTTSFFALHLASFASPEHIGRRLGARHEGPIGELAGHHKFSALKGKETALDAVFRNLRTRRKQRLLQGEGEQRPWDEWDGILWAQRLVQKDPLRQREAPPLLHVNTSTWMEDPIALQVQQQLMSDLNITDPGFRQQWHLLNTVQLGQDMNVTSVWSEGVTGRGVVTAIIDNGLYTSSEDLLDNYFSRGSYDFNEHKESPQPGRSGETHGTRCAGEVAAGKNGVCGIGMAYDSQVAGIRLLSGPIDESDEATALTYKFHDNQIYSCSWGPPDNGAAMAGPGPLFRRALMTGTQNGRHGRGSIYVFAAGNGGYLGDNCNFDGYTNSIYTITIGAATREGKHAEYTEPCAAQLAVAYSSAAYKSEGADAVYTTDVGVHSCTHAHGGTSAAGPLAAGAVALALSVRPALTWRDVQYLLRDTAVPMDQRSAGDWQVSSTGKRFSHLYGFGKIDTYGLVQRAKEWTLVKPQAWYHSPWLTVDEEIPEGAAGVASVLEVTQQTLQKMNLARLEHVTVTMNIGHMRRGDLSVELHSPGGMVSYLSNSRIHDDEAVGYRDWTFSTVAHWGEDGVGVWTVLVKDTEVNSLTGKFVNWRLTLWGEAIDGASQPLHPLSEAHDDDGGIFETTAGSTSTEHASIPSFAVDRPDLTGSSASSSANWSGKGFVSSIMREPWWIWAYGVILLFISSYLAIGTCLQSILFARSRRRGREAYALVFTKDTNGARDRAMQGDSLAGYGLADGSAPAFAAQSDAIA